MRLFFPAIACLMVVAGQPALARGTYHHPQSYVVHPDPHRTHGWDPVMVYSPAHGHYHLTYHPDSD
jgi:hypothetical protein